MPTIHTISDIHLEHRRFEDRLDGTLPDAVILTGDIGNGVQGIDWASGNYPEDVPVFYIPGNHEYYGHDIDDMNAALRVAADNTPNVRLLDRDVAILITPTGRVRILGCTLWTDYLLEGVVYQPMSMQIAAQRINDHKRIRTSSGLLTPATALALHQRDIAWLEDAISQPFTGATIVASHHAPSRISIEPRRINSKLNASFISDLDRFIMKHQPEIWLHGHTHWPVDAYHGTTRVVSRQVGYPGENVPVISTGYIEIPGK